MTTEPKTKRLRLQFSLRKLLMWAPVIAMYVGIARILNVDLGTFVWVTCWLSANGIICAVSHVLLASVFSAIVGAVVFWQGLFVGVLAGMAVGGAVAAIVDMVRCAVNWAGNRLEKAASDNHP
jgi:hypothetical protein